MTQISWIQPLFHHEEESKHTIVGVAEQHKTQLLMMADKLVSSGDVLATYIPEGTDYGYTVGSMHGRVVNLLTMLPMPEDKSIESYPQMDKLSGKMRWPYGWPCEVVCSPPIAECCRLRDVIDSVHGFNSFGAWSAKFKNGPVSLSLKEKKALMAYFEPYYDFEK